MRKIGNMALSKSKGLTIRYPNGITLSSRLRLEGEGAVTSSKSKRPVFLMPRSRMS
jgi:hypothetical protein